MAGSAIAAGMQAFGHTEVTGFELERGQIRAVETTRGRIRTGTVVLAAGIWGPKVARLAGVRLPLTPVVHQYAITAPLPELAGETREVAHPLLRHQDADLYYRQIGDAYGIGNYDHEPRLVDAEAIRPWTADGEQPSILPFTPEDFERAAEETARLLPAVGPRAARALVRRPDVVHARRHAADRRGRRGARAVAVRGDLGHALRRRGQGARRAARPRRRPHRPARVRPAALRRARALAHVRAGARRAAVPRGLRRPAPAPAERAAARRCGARRCGPRSATSARSSSRARAGSARSGSRPTRVSTTATSLPRHDWPAQQWSPIVAAEHRACRERVGMFDLTPFTKVEVHGPGALAFLQELAANDVDRPAGTIVYTAMCAPRGGIMCDLTITRLDEERFLVVTGGAVGRHDIAWMTRHLPWDGSVVLEDKTSALCCIGLWGPRARDMLAALAEEDVSNAAFPYMTARDIHIGPVPVRALRISYVGELGWELYAPTEFGLHAVGAALGGGRRARRRRLRRRGLRLAAAREGLPALGPGHRRGARPVRGGPRLGRAAREGPVPRARRARGGQARRRRAGCAASSTDDPTRRARRQGADPRRRRGDRLRDQRRARRLASARASSTATCRWSGPRSGPRSRSTSRASATASPSPPSRSSTRAASGSRTSRHAPERPASQSPLGAATGPPSVVRPAGDLPGRRRPRAPRPRGAAPRARQPPRLGLARLPGVRRARRPRRPGRAGGAAALPVLPARRAAARLPHARRADPARAGRGPASCSRRRRP